MKLIIDISEEIYKEAVASGYSYLYDEEVANAVAEGIPFDLIDELEKLSGKTLLEILACFASDDEYPAFKCDDCPLRLKGICVPRHPGKTCYELWLNYLTERK